MHTFRTKALVLLALIWMVAGGVIFWTRNTKATPESIERDLQKNPVASQSPDARGKTIERVADQLNQLTYEQRREFRMRKKLDGFFRALTPEEQARFLDLTLPAGFKQMMEAFNKMEPEKRKRFVDRALKEMQDREGEDQPLQKLEDPQIQKIVNEGLKSFYSDASAEVKMDFAPLIEQMQRNLQR